MPIARRTRVRLTERAFSEHGHARTTAGARFMTPRLLMADMTESRDRADKIDPVLVAEPIASIDPKEPIDQRTESSQPNRSTARNPFDAIERNESSDQSERRELLDDMGSACRSEHRKPVCARLGAIATSGG
jgi:hypothetical protein